MAIASQLGGPAAVCGRMLIRPPPSVKKDFPQTTCQPTTNTLSAVCTTTTASTLVDMVENTVGRRLINQLHNFDGRTPIFTHTCRGNRCRGSVQPKDKSHACGRLLVQHWSHRL
jgi:hypothetical protein